MNYVTCPDCNAERDNDLRLTHTDTCPLGRGWDDSAAEDRMWFELHPNETARRRPPHWAEIAELRLLGELPPPEIGSIHGSVLVTRIADGVRTRNFDNLWIVLTPEAVA